MRFLAWVLATLALALLLASAVIGAAPFKAGDLDTSFDGDGKARTDFAGSKDTGFGVVVQGDGKVVVGGAVYGAGAGFALARYQVDGGPDPTFDADGKVRTSFAAGSSELGYAIALQVDEKIVMAGSAGIPGSGTASDFALARYNADGSLDASFGGDGKVVTDFTTSTDQALAVAVQSDGKILATGASRRAPGSRFDYATARYNPDGTLDTSFSGDGKIRVGLGGTDEYAQTIVAQPDGKLLVGGVDQTNAVGVLMRFLPEGSLDLSFDGDGVVVRSDNGSISDVALQADGKILIAGEIGFSVTRLNADGSTDSSFGGGTATTALQSAIATSLLVQPDGRIVAAGYAEDDFAVGRFEPNADPDETFGSDGTVTTDLGGPADSGFSVARAPDGKIVVAGSSGPIGAPADDFAVARYQGTPSPCTVPNVRGKALAAARTRIGRAGCTVGKVKRKRSKRVKKGRVISQSPRAGNTVPNGAKVTLVVSKGSGALGPRA